MRICLYMLYMFLYTIYLSVYYICGSCPVCIYMFLYDIYVFVYYICICKYASVYYIGTCIIMCLCIL